MTADPLTSDAPPTAVAEATATPISARSLLRGDLMLAVGFLLATQLEVWLLEGDDGSSLGRRLVVAVLVAIASMSLAWRRTRPFASFLANTGAIYLLVAVGQPSDFYQWTNLVAVYSIAVHGTVRQAWWGLALAVAAVVAYFTRLTGEGGLLVAGFVITGWVAAWLVGRVSAANITEAQLRAERDLSRQVASANEERLVLEEERARIARELHDIIGHSVNVMVVHAGAGRGALDRDVEATRDALATIESTGRTALDELDRVLAILRRDADDVALAPLPGLGDLDDLAATFVSSGLPVEVATTGQAVVPDGVAVSVYRIVQEALTNTLRHARATGAAVQVATAPGRVDVHVRDDGVGLPTDHRRGRGLQGMQERVGAHDGSLVVEDVDDGVEVRATLRWDTP